MNLNASYRWLAVLLLPVASSLCPADSITAKGRVYEDVTILKATPTHLMFTYREKGKTAGAVLKFEDLPEALQQQYGFSPDKAEAYRALQEQRDAETRKRLATRAPEVPPLSVVQPAPTNPAPSAAVRPRPRTPAAPRDWQVRKSAHALVHYRDASAFSEKAGRYVEERFNEILKRLDVIKGLDLTWSMENAVKLYVYDSRDDMVEECRLPAWAGGAANYPGRSIYMPSEEEALKNVVSHELGHLVFYNLMGDRPLPRWIAEGVAQWLEPEDARIALRKQMSQLKQGRSVPPLDSLLSADGRSLTGAEAAVFYAGSFSLVGFLIDVHGFDVFKLFCHQVQNGMKTDDALQTLYGREFRDLAALEKAWQASL